MSTTTAPSSSKRYPIQVAARRSGVNVELLRAWERRYAVVDPGRQESGRRLYSDDDVARLVLLRQAVERGLRIKDAATRNDEELRAFLDSEPTAATSPAGPPREGAAESFALLDQCRSAVRAQDMAALEVALDRARVGLSVPILLDEVLGPLVAWIGESWGEGSLRIYDEHRATVVLRDLLASLARGSRAAVATVVVTTPAGELHELGAMMAAAASVAAGWKAEYLGPDLPAAEIAAATARLEARAICLSIVTRGADSDVAEELQLLRRLVGRDVAIFVGGRGVEAGERELREIDARVVKSAAELARALNAIPL